MQASVVTEINAERSAVRGDLIEIEYPQTVSVREPIDREKRKIREMLVIDGIELVLDHKAFEVRELQRNNPFRSQQSGHSSGEVVEVRNLRQNIISDDQVGTLPLRHQATSQC